MPDASVSMGSYIAGLAIGAVHDADRRLLARGEHKPCLGRQGMATGPLVIGNRSTTRSPLACQPRRMEGGDGRIGKMYRLSFSDCTGTGCGRRQLSQLLREG